MTTAALRLSTPLPEERSASRKGLFARFYDALIEARMRHALQEIARHRHLLPENLLKGAGYDTSVKNDAALPFTRQV